MEFDLIMHNSLASGGASLIVEPAQHLGMAVLIMGCPKQLQTRLAVSFRTQMSVAAEL